MRDTEISACFDRCFLRVHNTRMVGGAVEPLYVPATREQPALLYYREDFAASALHEAAHWCIAGTHRRLQTDFGYHYEPPPRNPASQQRFFAAEVRTQTLESLFAAAAGIEFRPSADNLEADLNSFADSIAQTRHEVESWVASSPDNRARTFLTALEGAAGRNPDYETGRTEDGSVNG